MKLWRVIVRCSVIIAALNFSSAYAESDEVNIDGGIPIASALITPGSYIAPRPSHFENVTVRHWFDKTLLEGNIFYGGHGIPFSLEVKQHPSGPHAFVADGFINQRWTTGATCKIPMKIEIQRTGNALQFRSYQPSAIRTSAPLGLECQIYNNYIWSFHEKPYVLAVPQP